MLTVYIDIINYVTGIGNWSRELNLVIHTLASNHCWKCFWAFQPGKSVFYKESSSRNTGMYCYTYIFFIVFKIVEQFQKRAQLQRSVKFIAEYCLIFNLWASRLLGGVYTRAILRKTFSKTFSLFIILQHLHRFISYARNGFNEYGNAGSLVSVGRGLSKTGKIMCRIRILPVSNRFCCLHKESERCEVVPFSKYTLL